ncbi:MAG: hypothetical protein GWM98_24425, partial [Nitrospinaceae bacterium]|nr:hypothetical protein [Nitrospinaceae bacterium]NIR57032.1 hypothetical protein [Nitrospinaceae bacterium]NIS87485.1 hypothetical protein [Nitrospinaceae bacterium]NIT84339.1 hypothetical protein [Nitrospinaceae bacterium]NIU46528.1 hypothetical protein [Nitrospinaceae bacterium]
NSKPLPQEDRFEQVVEQLEPGQEILFTQKIRDNNNSIAYGLQVGERNFDLQARMSLIASIVESDFYTR